MDLAQDVLKHVGGPLRDVEQGIRHALVDASEEAQALTRHLTESGGKRVRPILSLLSGRLFSSDLSPVVPIGVAAELIHMATLVHDDVIDRASTRRGRKSVNHVWGNRVSVLAGDALLARALVMLVDHTTPAIVRIMSDMIYRMCEGEIAQHATLHSVDQSKEDYFNRIEKKTALFFAACCQAGALAAGSTPEEGEALWHYGRNLGMAFQVIDDMLDISAQEEVVGKPVAHDFRTGILTLPVLHLLEDERYADRVTALVQKGEAISSGEVEQLLGWVRENGAIDYTFAAAVDFSRQAQAALDGLPQGGTRDLLQAIAESTLTRRF